MHCLMTFTQEQKKACAIILGKDYASYEYALTTLNLKRLDARRTALTLDFAIKCSKSPKHSHFFASKQ